MHPNLFPTDSTPPSTAGPDEVVVPDWFRDTPAPAPPKYHVKPSSEDKTNSSNESPVSRPRKVSEINKDHGADSNDGDSSESEEVDGMEAGAADPQGYEDAAAKEEHKPEKVEIPANSSDEDQTAWSVVDKPKRVVKKKDPSAPAPSKKERDDHGEKFLVIKGRPPKIIEKEISAAATEEPKSNNESKIEATGEEQKATPAPPLPKPKSKNKKKWKKVELAEPVEEAYIRPTSKVAKKFSHYAHAAGGKDDATTPPTNITAAATIAKLKSDQDAIIRKKKSKVAAVPVPLKRALTQKRREQQRMEDDSRAAEREAYNLNHPPSPSPQQEALPTRTRLQKAFEAMQKGQVGPAIDIVTGPKVRKHLPKNVNEDKELMWKVVKYAFIAFVLFLFYELHLA